MCDDSHILSCLVWQNCGIIRLCKDAQTGVNNEMKIAFFDAKPYDVPGFEKCGKEQGIEFKFFESLLYYPILK